MPKLNPQQTAFLTSQLASARFPGIGPVLAARIVRKYQETALQAVQENPYQLTRDILGIGFTTADKLAQSLGFAADHPYRLEAGLEFALQDSLTSGHVYLPKYKLVAQAQQMLKVEREALEKALQKLLTAQRLAEEGHGIYLSAYRYYELRLADLIHKLINFRSGVQTLEEAVSEQELQSLLQVELAREQKSALETALTEPFTVITGGPGTGKSTAIQALCRLLKAKNRSFILAAPTGRAARRLSELTGQEAFTLHRLLKIRPGQKPLYNQQNPLLTDFLIVDESSMLDLPLAYFTLAAAKPGTHLVWVGDADQLPSVGPGNVLRDVIGSKRVPVVTLSHIFRQQAKSVIPLNAARIKDGQAPFLPKHPTDFYFFPTEKPSAAAELILELVTERIPRNFDLEPGQIQVLSPMYKSEAGVSALNTRLQQSLNPPRPDREEIKTGGSNFRVGDKVMQISNNYEKEVFNGELGIIRQISNHKKQRVKVEFDGREVDYQAFELDQLTHAFAVSIHKSQGGEFEAVVLPILTAHYILLERNLLYTAVTRAKKLCVLVGQKKALWIAVRNNKPQERYTYLKERLIEGRMRRS